jgi:PKD repeat protein
LKADFSTCTGSGTASLKVKFTDKSSDKPTSWKWSFGDGTSSTCKHPTHTYDKAGKYTVTLTVKDAAGNTAKKCRCVVVSEPPKKECTKNTKNVCKETKKTCKDTKKTCKDTKKVSKTKAKCGNKT